MDAEAIEAEQAWKVPLAEPGTAPPSCVERPSLGPIAVLRSGRDVLVLAGPYVEADRTSDATCKEVLLWGKKLLPKARVTEGRPKPTKPKESAPVERVKPEGAAGSTPIDKVK